MKTLQISIGAMLLSGAAVLAATNTVNRNFGGHSTTMNVPSGVVTMPSGIITNMPSSVLHVPSGVITQRLVTMSPRSTVITNPPDDTTADATNQPVQTGQ